MTASDAFEGIARYYDPIMEHVDYERWYRTVSALGALLPKGFRHLDAACGTGTLLHMLREAGWHSAGVDLSPAMLRACRKKRPDSPVAVADLCALPVFGGVDLITCLFDSMNFLIDDGGPARAMREFAAALRPGGVLYFDIVTERMVTDHFEGQFWTEDNGTFKTTWTSSYDRASAVVDTGIRINTGAEAMVRERIHPTERFIEAVAAAGLHLAHMADANTGRAPNDKTARIDFFVLKQPPHQMLKALQKMFKRASR